MLTLLRVSVCTASVSPAQSPSASPLPLVRGFPALRVPYGRVRLPPSHQPSSEWFFRSTYSADMRPRRRWISQVPDASISGRAVLLDPAAVSGGHRHSDRLLLPSRYSTLSACGCRLTRLDCFTCVTARPSLCLRLAHVVTSISPRLDSRWGGLAPCRGGNFTRWMRQAWPGAPK